MPNLRSQTFSATISTSAWGCSAAVAAVALGWGMASAQAESTVWKGEAGSSWSEAENWTPGIPTASSAAEITVPESRAVIADGAATAQSVRVSSKQEAPASLEIRGDLTVSGEEEQGGLAVGSDPQLPSCKGVVEHTAGRVEVATTLRIAALAEKGAPTKYDSGVYRFGGKADAAPAFHCGSHVVIGALPGETGSLELSGHGRFEAGGGIQIGLFQGKGEMSVTGGDLEIVCAGISLNRFNGPEGASMRFVGTATGFGSVEVRGNCEFGEHGTYLKIETADDYQHEPDKRFDLIRVSGGFTGAGMFRNVKSGEKIVVGTHSFQIEKTENAITLVALP